MICSFELNSSSKQQPGPSLSESDSFVQLCDNSSIGKNKIIQAVVRKLKKDNVFPYSLEENPTSHRTNTIRMWRTKDLCRRYGYSIA